MEQLLTWVKSLARPDKNDIRKRIKRNRLTLTPSQEEEWNQLNCLRVLQLEPVMQAFCVYCYVSLPHESGTKELIDNLMAWGKCVAVPKVEGKRLVFYAINTREDLETGTMGILEPREGCLRVCDRTAPVIVPGLAFDQGMHRIGYGGGYYDRFLHAEPRHLSIGLAYPFQIVKRLPSEPHDKAMDLVITPYGWNIAYWSKGDHACS